MTLDPQWIGPVLATARPAALGVLLGHFRDLDLAEEAVQTACLRALKNWPERGPPRNPTGWLVTVGRNAGVDGLRRRTRETGLPEELAVEGPEVEDEIQARREEADYADDLLRLLFVCCHRELPPAQQVALALRVVSGLGVPQIARAFLVSEAAMEQRLTRAKRAVTQAGLPFEAPGPLAREERLGAVLAMVYLLFNEGYTAPQEAAVAKGALCDEAIRLARLLLRMFPEEPEVMGLLALLLLQHARAGARFDAEGGPVLLEEQDRGLWDRERIGEGLVLVARALRLRRPGRFQVEAAIAALHARAPSVEATDWPQVAALYEKLAHLVPSPVVELNRAVALSRVEGPGPALAHVEPLAPALGGYFYFHGVRGHLLQRLGRGAEAREAYGRAIALARTAAEAVQIRRYLDQLGGPPA
ncbi:RNA polymerase sigma factor [Rubellimicrobium roseum]|uniref:RNA polymerase sigma factor n=1 Tax=Rubellimicrobium roseum TaxID=687525 RepID=A0A5C4NJI3_9RHOB|nr:RNA polymerase sigma factor [Rubellimicrobium roseum]TNC74961.1 RNA polymerase sigma factor [Rubellimicrobium roseum]